MVTPEGGALDGLLGQVEELQALRADEAHAKAEAAHLGTEARKLEAEICDAAALLGLSELKLDTGQKVTFGERVTANAKKPEAIAWLDEHGHGDLIKNQLAVRMDRGFDDDARQLFEELVSRGLNPTADRTVHHSTLSAFIRGLLEQGVPVPLDAFNVHIIKQVKVK